MTDHVPENFREYCDFCNKHVTEGLFNGIRAQICFDCINKYGTINPNNFNLLETSKSAAIPDAVDIKAFLDRFVVGQDLAKQILSIAVVNHLIRSQNPAIRSKTKKTNLLLIGPSGTGKTLLVRTLAKLLKVPCVLEDATQFSQRGYVGRDTSDLFSSIHAEIQQDPNYADNAIVFIDEFDKLAFRDEGEGHVSTSGVQKEFLKIIEGTTIYPGQSRGKAPADFAINTNNMLFILGGAFTGLSEIVNGRATDDIGFTGAKQKTEFESIQDLTQDHLIEFGIMPELVGRISIIAPLKSLTNEEIRKTMFDIEENLMLHYETLFSLRGIGINPSDSFINKVIQRCQEHKLGVRGVQSLLDKSLLPLLFNHDKIDKTKPLVLTDSHVSDKFLFENK